MDGSTALHAAAIGGHTGTVRLLIDHGSDPRAVNAEGRNATDVAEAAQHVSTAAFLRHAELQKKQQVEAKLAADARCTEMKEAARLIRGKAEEATIAMKKMGVLRRTALQVAAGGGNNGMVEALLARGAGSEVTLSGLSLFSILSCSYTFTLQSFRSALRAAASAGHLTTLEILLDHWPTNMEGTNGVPLFRIPSNFFIMHCYNALRLSSL